MGLFDRLRPQDHQAPEATAAPGAVGDGDADHAVVRAHRKRPAYVRPVNVLLAVGIDGQGPLSSAVELADTARANASATEDAIAWVTRTTVIRGAAGGFVTGVGGFASLPVAVPVNVVEFYVQAARMVSAIATLRGHDVTTPGVRKAVLQTLVRTQSDSGLVKAVSGTRGGALPRKLMSFLPAGALLVANKGIGFRLLRLVAERLFGRFGRGVPVIGGIAVAFTDAWMMGRIAEQAKADFPVDDFPVDDSPADDSPADDSPADDSSADESS